MKKLIAKKQSLLKRKQDGGEIKMVTTGGEGPRRVFVEKQGGQLSKDYIEKAREKPGGSNVGKKTFASGAPRTGPYAGPSGGAPKGSYPIPDEKHAKSALALAHNAPNPSGIKSAVYKKYPGLKKGSGGIMAYAIGGKTEEKETQFGSEVTDYILNGKRAPHSTGALGDTLAARYHRAALPLRQQLIAKSPKFGELLKKFEGDKTWMNSKLEEKLDSAQLAGFGSYPTVPVTPEYVKAAEEYSKFVNTRGTETPLVGKKEIQFNEGKLGYFGPRSASFKAMTPKGQSPYFGK